MSQSRQLAAIKVLFVTLLVPVLTNCVEKKQDLINAAKNGNSRRQRQIFMAIFI